MFYRLPTLPPLVLTEEDGDFTLQQLSVLLRLHKISEQMLKKKNEKRGSQLHRPGVKDFVQLTIGDSYVWHIHLFLFKKINIYGSFHENPEGIDFIRPTILSKY